MPRQVCERQSRSLIPLMITGNSPEKIKNPDIPTPDQDFILEHQLSSIRSRITRIESSQH